MFNSAMGNVVHLLDWELWQHAQRLSLVTIQERLRVIQMFGEQTQVQPMSATATDIVRWLAGHRDHWSESTTATYTAYLGAWFKWLQLQEHRLDNPMVKVGPARYPDLEPRPIADGDVAQLLVARMQGRTRAMILLALLAGLRVHEIAKVRGEDVDLQARVIYVMGKGRKMRSIPLHPVLMDLASEMPPRGFWFPMRGHPAEHVHSKSVSDIVGRTMRRAGVAGSAHRLRHWFGTTLLDDGADIRTVQELLRHASLATTQRYTKVSDKRRTAAVARLDPFRGSRAA